MLWRCAASAAVVAALLSPGAALAQAQLDLDWEAPAGCPQAAAVRARVRSLTGDSRATLHSRAQGRITRIDGHYRLTVSLYEGGVARDRTIDSASCADLAGAAAVALGLWLRQAPNSTTGDGQSGSTTTESSADGSTDPAGADGATSKPSATISNTTGGAGNASDAEKPAASERKSQSEPDTESPQLETPPGPARLRHWHVFLRAPLLAVDVARLPTPSVGLGADLGVRYDDWRFGGGARIFQNQTLWSRQISDIGAKVARFTAQGWTCRRFVGARLELAPCLLIGLERSSVRGVGPNVSSRTEHVTSLLFGAGGSAYLYPTDWMALVGTVTLSFASAEPRLSIDGLDEIRQLGPALLGFNLGSEWIF
jgi:hypothetical protein